MTKRAQLQMVLALAITALLAALALGATTGASKDASKGDLGLADISGEEEVYASAAAKGTGSAQSFASSSEQYTDPSGSQPETVEALVESAASDVNIFWEGFFEANGAPYSSPYLAYIYDEPVETGCGISDTSQGPGYCRLDQTFYFPVGWTDSSTGGSYLEEYGDFAVAVIVAHEMAHHVQQQMDILDIQDVGDLLTIESELQADCFAGAWANAAYYEDQLEEGDLEEALSALEAAGDPEGTAADDPGAHGSSEQRQEWFLYGYDTGDITQCVTYSQPTSSV